MLSPTRALRARLPSEASPQTDELRSKRFVGESYLFPRTPIGWYPFLVARLGRMRCNGGGCNFINPVQFRRESPTSAIQREPVHLLHIPSPMYLVQDENGPRGGAVPKGPRLASPHWTRHPCPPGAPAGNPRSTGQHAISEVRGVSRRFSLSYRGNTPNITGTARHMGEGSVNLIYLTTSPGTSPSTVGTI